MQAGEKSGFVSSLTAQLNLFKMMRQADNDNGIAVIAKSAVLPKKRT